MISRCTRCMLARSTCSVPMERPAASNAWCRRRRSAGVVSGGRRGVRLVSATRNPQRKMAGASIRMITTPATSSSTSRPHPMSSGLLQPGPSRGTWTAAGLNGETGVVEGSATGVLLYHRDPAAASGVADDAAEPLTTDSARSTQTRFSGCGSRCPHNRERQQEISSPPARQPSQPFVHRLPELGHVEMDLGVGRRSILGHHWGRGHELARLVDQELDLAPLPVDQPVFLDAGKNIQVLLLAPIDAGGACRQDLDHQVRSALDAVADDLEARGREIDYIWPHDRVVSQHYVQILVDDAAGSMGYATKQQREHLRDGLVARIRARSHAEPPEHQLVARLIRQLVIVPHPVGT